MGKATNPRPALNLPKERITIALQLEVSGCDLNGREFIDHARTKIVSRGGAAIVINRPLAAEQTLTIKRVGSEQEAEVRVVGHLGKSGRSGEAYGVVFSQAASNFWGIDFPAEETEEALVKMLVECPKCYARQMVALSQTEFNMFEAKGHLSRTCYRCHDATLWRQAAYGIPSEPPTITDSTTEQKPSLQTAPAPAVTTRQLNRRRHPRVKTGLKGCIVFYGQETPIEVTDMSRSGIHFCSHRSFAQGLLVRVAVPYTPGAANILVSGRICWCRTLSNGISECGLEYERYATPLSKQ